MTTIIGIIAKLLGFGGDQSTTNAINGVVNLGALAGVAGWAYDHWDQQMHFTMSTGSMVLIAGAAYVLIELNRRT